MSDQDNARVVQGLIAAFKKGDIQTVLNGLADDVVWEVPGPPAIPFAGRRFGRGQVAGFFGVLNDTAELPVFEPRDYIAQGDKVVALGTYAGRAKTTGREFGSEFAILFTLRGGKVAEFYEYMDNANLAAAFDTGEAGLEDKAGTP